MLIRYEDVNGQRCIERVSKSLADRLIAADIATPAAIEIV